MDEHFLCSSCSHTWDAFQLAHASFRLYCVRNNYVLPDNGQKDSSNHGPQLLGDAPKINIVLPDRAAEEGEETSSDSLLVTKINDGDVDMRLLICGLPCTLVSRGLLFLEVIFVSQLFHSFNIVTTLFRMHVYWVLWKTALMPF